jgi:hypothetical protein
MYKGLSEFTKNYSISPKKFYDLKRRYLGLYKAKLLEAFDLGYTVEPEVFSESDFLKAYSEEGINLEFQDGIIVLKSWVFYLEWLMSGKENEFYKLMCELLEYREACSSIDTAYDGIKMYKAKASKSLTWGVSYTSTGMVGTSRMVQLNEVTYQLLLERGYRLGKYSLTHPLVYGLSEEWDVPVSQVLNTTIFPYVTIEDIRFCLGDVFSSEVVFSNPQVQELFGNYLNRHANSLRLYDLGRKAFFEELDEELTPLRYQKLPVLGISDYYIFTSELKDDNYEELIPIGAFSVDYDTSEVLPLVNNLYGVTGDFISLGSSSILEGDYNYIGCPIMLVGADGSSSLYLDVEQVVGLGVSSLISDLGLKLTFSEQGSHATQVETDLVDFYVNGFVLQDEGTFIRTLKGNYSQEQKDLAIKQAIKDLGLK